MLLTEIFENLQYGEFSMLNIGGGVCGDGIQKPQYPALISHLNVALTQLHKKFPLIQKAATIIQDETINIYYLDSAYAASNTDSAAPIKYILDTEADPFEDLVFKIERIEDEEGCELVVDDESDPDSLFIPTFKTIQVPFPVQGEALGVVYRANYPKISHIGLEPENTVIDISDSLLLPLLYFMAHRAYAGKPPIDGVDNSAVYFAKYQAAVNEINELDLVHSDTVVNTKLDDNGWA